MEVEVISKEHVKPSSPTPGHLRTYRLSLLDQLVPTAHIPMILFYDAPTAFSTDEALRRLKQSVSQALPEFYPFAGKIKDDLYIDCNDDGVYYAEAKVNCSLSDVLARPDAKVIGKLLPDEPSLLESTSSDGDGVHVVMVQVNVFECGGIALGAYLSHKIIDGPTCVTLLKAWSATARGSAGEVTPSFIAPSLFPQSESIPSDYMLGIWPALLKFGTCVTKRFVFDATAIAAIKSAAAHPSLVAHPTRIEAISAFIWGRCIAATEARRDGARRPSVLSHMINLRSKNKSSAAAAAAALPEHMIGNLIWIVTARSEPESERNLQSLTSALRESLLKLNVNFFEGLGGEEAASRVCKCLEEMSEVYGDEEADYFGFSSLFNVGVYEADFGWGKPAWVSPGGINLPVYQNLVFLIETRRGDGIEAWVTLGGEDMAALERDADLLSYASVEPSPLEPRR